MKSIVSPRIYISKSINNIRLNLSGEINILTADITKSIFINDELYAKVSVYAKELRQKHPYINIDVVRELHELTIKLFSFNKHILNKDILDNIQYSLESLVDSIIETNGLNIRLNISGNIKTWEKLDKFIFLNKDHTIRYKITETLPMNEVSILMGKLAYNLTLDLKALTFKKAPLCE